MSKKKMALAGCFLALTAGCGSVRADFKYTESSKMTGGAMMSMMKVAGVFSKQARQQSHEPTVTTQYVKGRKMRRDESDGQSTIVDLDARQIIMVDNKKHTYSVMTFDQMRQMIAQQKAALQEEMAKADKQNPQKANIKITPKISVTDGTGSRTIAGLPTHEVKMDLEMLMEATDPNQPSKTGQVQTWVKSDQYVTPTLPGSEQFREFREAMAKELDWLPGEVFGGNLQVSMSMDELRKQSASMKGFPMLQYISMGMGAAGQGGATESGGNGGNGNGTSGQQPPQQQSSSASDITSPSEAAAKALGGMFGGFHRHKKDQEQNSSSGASPSTPPQPSQPGSLIEMTVEVTSFSTDSLDSSLFAPPAGYAQVQPDLNRGLGAAH